eukprot:TRINITY_DN9093_c0_g1_i3.p1 TRINITY_DN9093_c0_g1~~TRINITY_DN9093_c0_g1_i3.p1  ORF type:complete len:604 (+),score=78.75 TRINITY_DN9093_c0_g1_i3:61-1872(+)
MAGTLPSDAPPPPLNIAHFLSLHDPLQKVSLLRQLGFVSLPDDGGSEDGPSKMGISKTTLRQAMLFGLAQWNLDHLDQPKHLHEIWQHFCASLRLGGFQFTAASSELDVVYWFYEGVKPLRVALLDIVVPPPPRQSPSPAPVSPTANAVAPPVPLAPVTTLPFVNQPPPMLQPPLQHGYPYALPFSGPPPIIAPPPLPPSLVAAAATTTPAPPLWTGPASHMMGATVPGWGAQGFYGPGVAPGYPQLQQLPSVQPTPVPLQPQVETAPRRRTPSPSPPPRSAPGEAPFPTTTSVFPNAFSLQGGMAFVFGENFTKETTFLFDWPYAEPRGWSFHVEPEFIVPRAAVVRIPPLYCDTGGRYDVRAYVLAEDSRACSKGDAQFSYLTGSDESDYMSECMRNSLFEVDDGFDDQSFAVTKNTKRKLSSSEAADAADAEEQLLLSHFERRHMKGKLRTALEHIDVNGRNCLHYMASLAHKGAIRYCLDQLGAEAAPYLAVQDIWHLTPLHLAVTFGRPATIELLMDASTPHLRELIRSPTEETQMTAWQLAAGNDDLLDELDRGMERATNNAAKACQSRTRKRKRGYDGPNINIDVVDTEGAICLSD